MARRVSLAAAVAALVIIGFFLGYRVFAPQRTMPQATPEGGQARELLAHGHGFFEKKEYLKAQEAFGEFLDKYPASDDVSKVQEALEEVNLKLLFSSVMTPDSFMYEVQKGDTLGRIAKRFGTTGELIARANDLEGERVTRGSKLKITKTKFSIIIDISQDILTLRGDDKAVKTYRVSCGANDTTPTGTFKITNKVIDPTWYSQSAVVPAGSPKNILGSRWLGISVPGYGIHGTTAPKLIGKNVTAGCVRMNNADVEELYAIVPAGVPVTIVE